jgi:hypothetical protein
MRNIANVISNNSHPPISHRLIAIFVCYTITTSLLKGLWPKISAFDNVSDSMIVRATLDPLFQLS